MTVCPELRPERPRPPPIFDLRLGGAEAAHCAYTGNFGVASASRPAVTDAIGQLVEGFGASGLLPHENSAGAEAEALGAEVPRSRWRGRRGAGASRARLRRPSSAIARLPGCWRAGPSARSAPCVLAAASPARGPAASWPDARGRRETLRRSLLVLESDWAHRPPDHPNPT
ncbi:unnamed protein product, partial [Prorocentrum cordatum]